MTYRESFGFKSPPRGTVVKIHFSHGLDFYIHWPGCPDHEDILEGWFKKKEQAVQFANDYGWVIQ